MKFQQKIDYGRYLENFISKKMGRWETQKRGIVKSFVTWPRKIVKEAESKGSNRVIVGQTCWKTEVSAASERTDMHERIFTKVRNSACVPHKLYTEEKASDKKKTLTVHQLQ